MTIRPSVELSLSRARISSEKGVISSVTAKGRGTGAGSNQRPETSSLSGMEFVSIAFQPERELSRVSSI